jgi:hypothetical protein
MPEKLHELQRQWLIEAARYKVLPLDDRLFEKLNPDLAGRPVLIKGKTQLLFGGMGRLSENCGDGNSHRFVREHAGRSQERPANSTCFSGTI